MLTLRCIACCLLCTLNSSRLNLLLLHAVELCAQPCGGQSSAAARIVRGSNSCVDITSDLGSRAALRALYHHNHRILPLYLMNSNLILHYRFMLLTIRAGPCSSQSGAAARVERGSDGCVDITTGHGSGGGGARTEGQQLCVRQPVWQVQTQCYGVVRVGQGGVSDMSAAELCTVNARVCTYVRRCDTCALLAALMHGLRD